MQQGVFDPQDQRFHPLYAYENPMYPSAAGVASGAPEWIRNVVLPAATAVTARVHIDVIERIVQRARLGEEVA